MNIEPLEIKALAPLKIWIRFSDNSEGEIDLSYLLDKPIFSELENYNFFKKVYINSETKAIAWNEELEICPNNLYLKINNLTFEEFANKKHIYATD